MLSSDSPAVRRVVGAPQSVRVAMEDGSLRLMLWPVSGHSLEEVQLCGCFRCQHGAPGQRIGVEFVGPADVPVFWRPDFECETDLVFREQGEQFTFRLRFDELERVLGGFEAREDGLLFLLIVDPDQGQANGGFRGLGHAVQKFGQPPIQSQHLGEPDQFERPVVLCRGLLKQAQRGRRCSR